MRCWLRRATSLSTLAYSYLPRARVCDVHYQNRSPPVAQDSPRDAAIMPRTSAATKEMKGGGKGKGRGMNSFQFVDVSGAPADKIQQAAIKKVVRSNAASWQWNHSKGGGKEERQLEGDIPGQEDSSDA